MTQVRVNNEWLRNQLQRPRPASRETRRRIARAALRKMDTEPQGVSRVVMASLPSPPPPRARQALFGRGTASQATPFFHDKLISRHTASWRAVRWNLRNFGTLRGTTFQCSRNQGGAASWRSRNEPQNH